MFFQLDLQPLITTCIDLYCMYISKAKEGQKLDLVGHQILFLPKKNYSPLALEKIILEEV